MRVPGAQERLVPRRVEGAAYYNPEFGADGVEVTSSRTPDPSTMPITWVRSIATTAFMLGMAVGLLLYAVGSHL